MSLKTPTSIGSTVSPTGQEFSLYTYAQLKMVNQSILKSRARDLLDVIKSPTIATSLPRELAAKLRTNGEEELVVAWILDAQAHLLGALSSKHSYTAYDFGLPLEPHSEAQMLEGTLPSIKRSHMSIMSTSPTKKP